MQKNLLKLKKRNQQKDEVEVKRKLPMMLMKNQRLKGEEVTKNSLIEKKFSKKKNSKNNVKKSVH